MKKYMIKVSLVLSVLLIAKIVFPMSDAYSTINSMIFSVSYKNDDIQITAPKENYISCDKSVTVCGSSRLSSIFLCLQGPSGEISVYPIEVQNGVFSKELWLRFGPGTYTVWAGERDTYFDGSIRFQVCNQSQEDYRYTTPSGYVDSDCPEIRQIAGSLIVDTMNELDKVRAINDYVVKNVSYDHDTNPDRLVQLKTALSILNAKEGICRDYAFLFAALSRAAGIPTRVVYGEVVNNITGKTDKHAWNEAYLNGRWINIDPTWNSGYILNDTVTCDLTQKYVDMPSDTFGMTHTVTTITDF